MRIVVYTAIIGDIDELWGIVPGQSDIEHIAFVNTNKREMGLWGDDPPRLLSKGVTAIPGWNQQIVKSEWGPRRTARHYKTLPHRYIPDADVWIWVDGNIRLRIPPRDIIEQYAHEDLVTFNHSERNCVYVEAAFCAQHGKDKRSVLETQVDRYRKKGFPEGWGLAETGIIIRRNTGQIQELNEAWWHEIENGSVRDQVALPYVCWKQGIRWEELPKWRWARNTSENWYYVGHGA